MTIEEVLAKEEKQIFDRKSIHIKPADLSDTLCAFANADGGTVAIGISDKHRRIEGVDYYTEQLNEILRTPIDFCNPTIPVTTEMVECINSEGKPDHVLLMHIEASPQFHANQADDAFIRVGDKSKKLNFEDRMALMYAKGVRYYEDEPVADATIEDLDLDFVRDYCKKIRYSKSPEEYLRENKKFITVKDGKERISVAAILLFGKNPQDYFPRAFIRFIRYDGTEAKVGKNMNVVKDVIFEGRILDQVEKAVEYIKIQMKEKTYLGHDGIFVTEEEYSEFVRTEIVVNAVTHRDYGIKGTDIQIKMFDDRLEVDSPGTFAGMVKKENIRYTHFSRNPKIAAFLKDFDYVKEYGEGVDRMCEELEAIGLPDPVFDNNTFILKTTIKSAAYQTLPIDMPKVADLDQKLPIDTAKSTDSVINGNDELKNLPIKLSEQSFMQMYSNKGYNEPTILNLRNIYNQVEVNQIFGSSYIVKILDCSERTARNLLTKLKEMGAVITVTGKGKGMYRFKYTEEI